MRRERKEAGSEHLPGFCVQEFARSPSSLPPPPTPSPFRHYHPTPSPPRSSPQSSWPNGAYYSREVLAAQNGVGEGGGQGRRETGEETETELRRGALQECRLPEPDILVDARLAALLRRGGRAEVCKEGERANQ